MNRASVAAFVLAVAFTGAAGAGAADYEWRIVGIVDGDTIRVDATPDLPPELAKLKVRVRGIDTPTNGAAGRPQPPSQRTPFGPRGGC